MSAFSLQNAAASKNPPPDVSGEACQATELPTRAHGLQQSPPAPPQSSCAAASGSAGE